ncbi:serine/threonine-protein kinase [Rubrobacter indicoceani]|uniref:serine/threonine-protein kinase n=1 Tax=Rubrobacter indicoceani TaxID=2051957 RepID=UPI000E5AE8E2|nr:serine/threonine-protein kinase [Rubrobacter indicoceani]
MSREGVLPDRPLSDETFPDGEDGFDGPPPLEPGAEPAPGYRVLAHIHRSAKFDVYDVWSAERACRCIAKTQIPFDDEEDPDEEREIFRRSGLELVREGRLLLGLTHPHIARAYEVIERRERTVLVTETITGQTLAHLIDNAPRRLPVPELTHLGLHLLSALVYLHGKGLLHLDLKPSNIVAERGMAKILDLSIAREGGTVKRGHGTLYYLSPEQAAGGEVTPKTDVWGLGATLYDAAANVLPFNEAAESESETSSEETSSVKEKDRETRRYEQLERRAVPVGRHRRLPKAFSSIIDSCLNPEPQDRPSVGAVMERLERFAASQGY